MTPRFTSVNDPKVTHLLNAGGIGVLRTDTLYGVVARADNEQAVQRVYELKGRDDNKSPIVLVSDRSQLFDSVTPSIESVLNQKWPGPVSVIIPSLNAPSWIRRGNDSVAYRLPANNELCTLLSSTGPLIAPSANPQGKVPAMSMAEAEAYFGASVDFYVDGGAVIDATPSQLLQVTQDGEIVRLR